MTLRRSFVTEETEAAVSERRYKGYIDSLKGWAVIAIILYHISFFAIPVFRGHFGGLPVPEIVGFSCFL